MKFRSKEFILEDTINNLFTDADKRSIDAEKQNKLEDIKLMLATLNSLRKTAKEKELRIK